MTQSAVNDFWLANCNSIGDGRKTETRIFQDKATNLSPFQIAFQLKSIDVVQLNLHLHLLQVEGEKGLASEEKKSGRRNMHASKLKGGLP